MDRRALFLLNLIGIGFVLTQNRQAVQGGADGNWTWLAYMVAAMVVGAVVAGVWHIIRKPSKEQTAKHFLVTAWVIAGLLTLGSFQ